MYNYKVELVRAIDGDTVELLVDLGFYPVTITEKFRLYGLNAKERYTEEGKKATAFVAAWFAKQKVTTIVSQKPLKEDKYGRWLAVVYGVSATGDLTILNDELIKQGLAVPYMLDKVSNFTEEKP